MMKNISKLTFLIVLSLLALVIQNCSEKDVPFAIDADEILLFMELDFRALELFNNENLFPSAPYDVPHLNSTFVDKVLSSKRKTEIDIIPLFQVNGNDTISIPKEEAEVDYGIYGMVREAWAIVTDSFIVETKKMTATDTTIDTTSRALTRYGFFVKVGDDNEDYLGWTLWGFRGAYHINPNATTTVFANINNIDTSYAVLGLYDQNPRSGLQLRASFVKLIDIPNIVKGANIGIETFTDSSFFPVLNFNSENGRKMIAMGQASPTEYFSSINTKDDTPQRYDIVFVQYLNVDSITQGDFFVVPYQSF